MGNALRAYVTTANLPTSYKTMLSLQGQVDSIRVELRAENEQTLSVNEQLLTASVVGTVAASKTPQDAVVLSLRTSTPGARGRGRQYWPALNATLSSSFQLTAPTPAAIAADTKTWLNAIGTQMNNVYIGNASALRVALAVRSTRDHVCRDVTSIQVGTILDTQRRRRDSLPESYASVIYP